MKTNLRHASLRSVLITAFVLIFLALITIIYVEQKLMDKINQQMAVLSHSAQRLQEGAGDMKYIVVNTQRLAFNSMLTSNQDMLLLAPTQSKDFYDLIDEMKLLLNAENPELKDKLDRLKTDYRNFLFKVIGVAAQYIERIETRASVLEQVNVWSEDFVSRLETISEEISLVSEEHIREIETYATTIRRTNMISLGAVMLVMLLMAGLIEWKLFGPLANLMAFVRTITGPDAAQVMAGYHNNARDEIGELGRSVDSMLRTLNQTTVSCDRLQQEVEERRRAESALKEIREHLEEKVSTRTRALKTSYEELKREIAERKEAERENDQLQAHLSQFQKMEALGNLAGGVAHDFNNIMAGVIGFAELAAFELKDASQVKSRLAEIVRMGNRGAELTRQLLTFSRQQVAAPAEIDLNEVVCQMSSMLERLIGENLQLKIATTGGSCPIKANQGQVEQVVMNLVVNARDAMPDGGTIAIRTAGVQIDEGSLLLNDSSVPGAYVRITIADTGYGMDASTQAKAFDPFFTTKAAGKGTGLGLSTVYGIVNNNRGVIRINSTLGKGTAVDVYFPRLENSRPIVPQDSCNLDNDTPAHHCGNIMLVEDEPTVLECTRYILERMGHQVRAFHDPIEAEHEFHQSSASVDILLTDVVMPKCDGPELFSRLIPQAPGLKAIFMSGYAEHHISEEILKLHNTVFVQKPINYSQMQDVIDSMLATVH